MPKPRNLATIVAETFMRMGRSAPILWITFPAAIVLIFYLWVWEIIARLI